jgi:hypothetical protein
VPYWSDIGDPNEISSLLALFALGQDPRARGAATSRTFVDSTYDALFTDGLDAACNQVADIPRPPLPRHCESDPIALYVATGAIGRAPSGVGRQAEFVETSIAI